MASFPRDQFDDIPDDLVRVGAHRAPARKGRGWLNLLWAILAVAVLILVGLFALSRLDPTNFPLPIFNQQTPTPTPTTTPTATPVTDPKTVPAAIMKTLTISVLNGTPIVGQADRAANQIHAAGWPNPARAIASDRTEKITYVYYSSPEYEGIARGLMTLLNVGDVRLVPATQFPGATITVVIGKDYIPPVTG